MEVKYLFKFYNLNKETPIFEKEIVSSAILFGYNKITQVMAEENSNAYSNELLLTSTDFQEDYKLNELYDVINSIMRSSELYVEMYQYQKNNNDWVLGFKIDKEQIMALNYIINNRVPGTNDIAATHSTNLRINLSTER